MILQFCDESLVSNTTTAEVLVAQSAVFVKLLLSLRVAFLDNLTLYVSDYVLNKLGHYRSGLYCICKCSPPEANFLWKLLHTGLLWVRNGKHSDSPWMKVRGTEKMSWLPGSQAVNFSLSFLTYSPVKQLKVTHIPMYNKEDVFTLLWDMCVISWSFLFRQLIVPRIFCV